MASASAALRLNLPRLPSPLVSSFHLLHFRTSFLSPSPSPSQLPPPVISSHSRLFSSFSSSLTPISTSTPLLHLHHDLQDEEFHFSEPKEVEGDEGREEEEKEDLEPDPKERQSDEPISVSLPRFPTPKLSVKEKKELASYAHSLGKKLKSQQVGKSGVTPSVAASFVENLESNELLKLKVHGSCPGELSHVIKQLEEATGSVAVDQIGRSVILYRPSLSKMKKKEAQAPRKVWSRKPKESVPTFQMQKQGQPSRVSGRRHYQNQGT